MVLDNEEHSTSTKKVSFRRCTIKQIKFKNWYQGKKKILALRDSAPILYMNRSVRFKRS